MDYKNNMEELRTELMKVIRRVSDKENATSVELEALAKVAEAFILTYS